MSTTSIIATIHHIPGLTAKSFRLLVEAHAFDQSPATWSNGQLKSWGLSDDQIRVVQDGLANISMEKTKGLIEKLGIELMTLVDPQYPRQLKEIPSPPPLLYVRGNIELLQRTSLAVVGTRKPTSYGISVTTNLVEPVAQQGIPVVSGLAIGIDTAAHRAALNVSGPTVAVLGCGLDTVYPWQNQRLADEIIARGGTIISEFPLGARPERHHFPQRNRIISGLSKAVLLVEAGEKSGALITAKFAVDQNREVLVVPGNITSPQSVGPLNWLKLGATPVTSATDIFNVLSFGLTPAERTSAIISSDDPIEAVILDELRSESRHIDSLAEACRLDSSVVSATLSLLEIRGLVVHEGGMIYRLNT